MWTGRTSVSFLLAVGLAGAAQLVGGCGSSDAAGTKGPATDGGDGSHDGAGSGKIL